MSIPRHYVDALIAVEAEHLRDAPERLRLAIARLAYAAESAAENNHRLSAAMAEYLTEKMRHYEEVYHGLANRNPGQRKDIGETEKGCVTGADGGKTLCAALFEFRYAD
jgi:hypothetical protein